MILGYCGKWPKIHPSAFIAPNATVIGDVVVEEGASIWYGAVVRGDMAPIYIGKNSNIQDNATVHTSENHPVSIGDQVTVGHNAVVHGCAVEDLCLIGIGAVVLDGTIIRKGSVVAASTLVKENEDFGENQLIAGIPGQKKKTLSTELHKARSEHAHVYTQMAKRHKEENAHES